MAQTQIVFVTDLGYFEREEAAYNWQRRKNKALEHKNRPIRRVGKSIKDRMNKHRKAEMQKELSMLEIKE